MFCDRPETSCHGPIGVLAQIHSRNRAGYVDRVANSGSFESFSVTLRGQEMPAVSGLMFDVGVVHLAGSKTRATETWGSLTIALGRTRWVLFLRAN